MIRFFAVGVLGSWCGNKFSFLDIIEIYGYVEI